MLKNRFNILLAERSLTASKVFEETQISKSTLSQLVNNSNDGIQFKTLDKLCNYLEISPNEFFDYAPFLYKFYSVRNKENGLELVVEIQKGNSLKTFWYHVAFSDKEEYLEENTRVKEYDCYLSVYGDSNEDPLLQQVYSQLSLPLKSGLKTDFSTFILKEISENLGDELSRISKKKHIVTLFRTPMETFEKTFDSEKKQFL